jgi:hypothetical protein
MAADATALTLGLSTVRPGDVSGAAGTTRTENTAGLLLGDTEFRVGPAGAVAR